VAAPVTVLGLALLAVAVGALIGSVGVGGVLLVPALVLTGVLGAHAATATSSWAFLFTGVVGTYRYGRHGNIPWPLVGRLSAGAIPAALVGVWVNQLLSGELVVLVLAAVTLFAGIYTLRPSARGHRERLGDVLAVCTGAVVGFGSALTGTGGPVLLVPALLALGVSPLLAVAASQVIQLPIVGMASAGYLVAGDVHIGLGTALGVAAAVGVLAGEAVARRASPARLRVAVALACIAAGLSLFAGAALNTLD
jgi:uncharacterized membrane protein YfcA